MWDAIPDQIKEVAYLPVSLRPRLPRSEQPLRSGRNPGRQAKLRPQSYEASLCPAADGWHGPNRSGPIWQCAVGTRGRRLAAKR